jgi:hypothetical protein
MAKFDQPRWGHLAKNIPMLPDMTRHCRTCGWTERAGCGRQNVDMPGDPFHELHGFWHFWHFLIFSSIRLTDERRRRAAMSGLFGHGPQLPGGFFRVSDELAIEADRSCATEPCLGGFVVLHG